MLIFVGAAMEIVTARCHDESGGILAQGHCVTVYASAE